MTSTAPVTHHACCLCGQESSAHPDPPGDGAAAALLLVQWGCRVHGGTRRGCHIVLGPWGHALKCATPIERVRSSWGPGNVRLLLAAARACIPAVGTERRQGLPPWSGRLQVLPVKPQALLGRRSPPGQWCLRRGSRVRFSDRCCLLLFAGMRWLGTPLRDVLDSITVRLRSRHPGEALDCLKELVPCAPRRMVDSCITRRVQQRSK